jgi:hypothetical protein
MVTVARFQTPEEAHLFPSFLESRGISAELFDEDVVQLFWHYSNAIGGVRVVVGPDDEEEAAEAHREYLEVLRAAPREFPGTRAWPVALLLAIFFGAPFIAVGRSLRSRPSRGV